MVIYVDILLTINFIVDFFLIRITSFFLKTNTNLKTNIFAAIISSLFSLFIFLPKLNILIELLIKLLPAITVALICNGYKNFKMFLRWTISFFAISFLYAGVMMAVWFIFKPQRLSVYNGVVYFNISPLILITLTIIFYFLFMLLSKLSSLNAPTAKRVEVTLFINDQSIRKNAMVDTGHTLQDAFGNNVMIIIDKITSVLLFGAIDTEGMLMLKEPQSNELKRKFRITAVNTVSGEKLMPGIRLDKMILHKENQNKEFLSVVAVISDSEFNDDYDFIIPDSILM